MTPTFNRNCIDCPVAVRFNHEACEAIGELAAQNTRIEGFELALSHTQQSYQIMQNLEATGLPGEVDQERALVKDVAGVELPTAEVLFSMRDEIKHAKVKALLLDLEASYAVDNNDHLMDGCAGPRSAQLGGLYISLCGGNTSTFRQRVFISRTRPTKLTQ